MTSASRHFTARPDGHGGVTLNLRRYRFYDQPITELGDDGVARSVPENKTRSRPDAVKRSTTSTDENGDEPTRQVVATFGPLQPGQSCEFEELDNGTINVVLVTEPDELLGNNTNTAGDTSSAKINTTLGNQGPRTRDAYIAQSYGKGSTASKLAQMQAANKAHYKR